MTTHSRFPGSFGGTETGLDRSDQEPDKSALAREGIDVINLSGVTSPDDFESRHIRAKPARRRAHRPKDQSGQALTDLQVGVGEKILQTTAGAAAGVGHAAGLVVSAPVAVVDPLTREQFGEEVDAIGKSIQDAATPQ